MHRYRALSSKLHILRGAAQLGVKSNGTPSSRLTRLLEIVVAEPAAEARDAQATAAWASRINVRSRRGVIGSASTLTPSWRSASRLIFPSTRRR